MAKLFQSDNDLIREEIAMKAFAKKYNLLFKKLDQFDIDFAVYNMDNKLIAYAEVKGRNREIKDAYPLPISIRKISKLHDKKLNPIVIWSCYDGIIYGKLNQLVGVVKYGGMIEQREGSANDQELMAYYDRQNDLKEEYIENFRNIG
jgi:hypothetical protein